ncbi:unnamed protein product (macronuclear) [Paramecium tetraurelia]|uniref:B box-type domain-containing protein n=1 Tax=Paramecium tetraurelia TaxID=5888 RepID=A0BGA9_PARTE|nr:uncharacterized protein GSPATT00028611001 [Paramecium tetraurelia]CAK57576.1 unnamed protein product [Paramecium tetraurelia]|eukprot:XP_001424974.1 hypothetical protein (macronuclear) [Paramecium tetraurelia strain d4-2]
MSVAPSQFEKCYKHPSNDIVLFCMSLECRQPLCKDCCKLHVQQHNQNGTQAQLDTVDNVRQQLLNNVHEMKTKFEEERAILHHFNVGESPELMKQIQNKLQKVKSTLMAAVNQYCVQLEEQVKQKIHLQKQSHPGEKKDLHHKLNQIILSLDQKEKMLLQPKYIRGCLMVMSDEQHHDFEQLTLEVDDALKMYLSNAFDVFVHEEKLQKISQAFTEYVDIYQANLNEELEFLSKKIRDNSQVPQMPKQKIVSNQKIAQQTIPIKETKQFHSIYDEKFSGSNFANQSQFKWSYGDKKQEQYYQNIYQ